MSTQWFCETLNTQTALEIGLSWCDYAAKFPVKWQICQILQQSNQQSTAPLLDPTNFIHYINL